MFIPDEDVKKEFIKKETKKKDESDFYFEITVGPVRESSIKRIFD